MTRRVASILVLATLILAQAMPVQAARMLCGMKAPAKTEACSRCDGPKPSDANGTVRAGNCCRIKPTEAIETPPVVLSSARRDLGVDVATQVTALAAVDFGAPDANQVASRTPGHAPPDPASLLRTTILRN